MLTSKLENEMHRRFGLDFDIHNRNSFRKFLRKYNEYGESERLRGIISLQTLRAKNMLERLREVAPRFDTVIIDEAHHMRNPETLSSELGETLSELSDAMLFLTATPLQLGTPDLFNLLGILIPEEFSDSILFRRMLEPNEYINLALRRLHEPGEAIKQLIKVEDTSQRDRFLNNPFYHEAKKLLKENKKLSKDQAIRLQKLLVELNCLSYVFTRTKKRDVETKFPIREARVIDVNFTKEELDFYNAITEFTTKRFTEKYGTSKGITFAVMMPQRQVASCIQAMKERLGDIIKKKTIKSPYDGDGDIIDLSADYDSSWKLESGEIAELVRLQKYASRLGDVDTKFDNFLKGLVEIKNTNDDSKIIVFAFFKKTLEYLKRKLDNTDFRGSVVLIHGDIKVKDRQKIIRDFRQSKDIKILLSSEVGGEGLDFEFCNIIFNYDLPWNPMRIEQRIGRLDRYGQKNDKILIYNFSMLGTIDDEILKRLYSRINVFEKFLGDLEAILGDEITELTRDMFNTELTEEQKIAKIEKVAENLERKKIELEEFERECQKFIGQDEYFNQEISRILESKRFITSKEVFFFLSEFLKNNFPQTKLKLPKSLRPNIYVMKLDDEFKDFIKKYNSRSENLRDLEKKMTYDGGFNITFNSEEACRDESLEFITIHHPIIKAIKNFCEKERYSFYSTAQLQLNSKGKYPGLYIYLIYLLTKTSLKKDLILTPVLFNLESNEIFINDEFSDWFLSDIISGEEPEKDLATYSEKELEKALSEAEDYLILIRDDEEGKLKRANNTLVDNQVISVKQATEIKIRKAEEIIKKLNLSGRSEDDRIVKLHRGRIRNFKIFMEKRIEELEEKRPVSVSYNLICGGVLKVI